MIDFLAEEGLEHGTPDAVRWGCRCAELCGPLAESKRDRRWRVLDEDGRLKHPFVPQHGTWNGYCNYKCRCWPCTKEGSRMRMRQRAKEETCTSEEIQTPPPPG